MQNEMYTQVMLSVTWACEIKWFCPNYKMVAIIFNFNKEGFFSSIFLLGCVSPMLFIFVFIILSLSHGSLSATNLPVTSLGWKKTLNTQSYILYFSHSAFHDMLFSMSSLFQKFFPLFSPHNLS